MDICSDLTQDGEWHFCLACRSTGDMIELAAHAWDTDEGSAIVRLAERGVPFPREEITQSGIERYLTNHVNRRRRMADFVNDRHPHFIPTAEAARFAGEIGMYWSSQGCVRHMGRSIFESNAVEMSRLIRPHVTNQTTATSGSTRIFKGRKWRNLLVVPFGDFPGRVTGFLMRGREGGSEDTVFYSLYADRYVTSNGHSHVLVDAGLAMSEVLYQPTYRAELFGANVFVTYDPYVAVAVQSRHLRDNERPLPLVGAYQGLLPPTRLGNRRPVGSRYVWWCQPRRRYVFWHSAITPELIVLAWWPGGNISVTPPPDHERRLQSHRWLQQVQRNARPWRDVLTETMETLPYDQMLDFLDALRNFPPAFDGSVTESFRIAQPILRRRTESVRFPPARSHQGTEASRGRV